MHERVMVTGMLEPAVIGLTQTQSALYPHIHTFCRYIESPINRRCKSLDCERQRVPGVNSWEEHANSTQEGFKPSSLAEVTLLTTVSP